MLRHLWLFLVLSFVPISVVSQLDFEKIIVEVEELPFTSFPAYKTRNSELLTSNEEFRLIIQVKELEIKQQLIKRFEVLVKLSDSESPYSDYTKAWANYHLSNFLALKRLDSDSFQKNRRSKFYADKSHFDYLKERITGNFAAYYYAKKDYAKAVTYYLQIIRINDDATNYNNVALCYYQLKKNEKALIYYKKGLSKIPDFPNENQAFVYHLILGNIGSVYLQKGDYTQAENYLFREYNYQKSLQTPDHKNLIFCLSDIIHLSIRQKKDYQPYFKSLLQETALSPSYMKPQILMELNERLLPYISKTNQDEFQRMSYPILLDFIRQEKKTNYAITKVLFKEKLSTLGKTAKLNEQKLTVSKKNDQYKTVILIVFIVLLILLSFFYVKMRINSKLQKRKDEVISLQEKQLAEAKEKLLESEITQQQELLQSFSINLKIKKETEERFLNELKLLKRKQNIPYDSLINEIQAGIQNLKEIDQKMYVSNMNLKINQSFRSKLLDIHPTLSKQELNYCHYCLLNLSSKEISLVTGQTDGAVRAYKNKIKTKLGLSKEENLYDYLKGISNSQ